MSERFFLGLAKVGATFSTTFYFIGLNKFQFGRKLLCNNTKKYIDINIFHTYITTRNIFTININKRLEEEVVVVQSMKQPLATTKNQSQVAEPQNFGTKIQKIYVIVPIQVCQVIAPKQHHHLQILNKNIQTKITKLSFLLVLRNYNKFSDDQAIRVAQYVMLLTSCWPKF